MFSRQSLLLSKKRDVTFTFSILLCCTGRHQPSTGEGSVQRRSADHPQLKHPRCAYISAAQPPPTSTSYRNTPSVEPAMSPLCLRAAVGALLFALALSAVPTRPTCSTATANPRIACPLIFAPVPCCLAGASAPCTASNGCVCGAFGGSSPGDGETCASGGGEEGPEGCRGPLPNECAAITCFVRNCCGRRSDGSVGCIPLDGSSADPGPGVGGPLGPRVCACTREFRPVCCRRSGGAIFQASNRCTCLCDGEIVSEDFSTCSSTGEPEEPKYGGPEKPEDDGPEKPKDSGPEKPKDSGCNE